MTRLTTLFLLLAQFGFVSAAAAQDAKAVIAEAMQAMGMTPTFTAVTFTGSAAYAPEAPLRPKTMATAASRLGFATGITLSFRQSGGE